MLDDQLTLLDGTEVVTSEAAARLTSMPAGWAAHVLTRRGRHEATLDGLRYYERDTALALVAGEL